MTNNDILKRIRYAFDFSNQRAVELFSLDPASSVDITVDQFTSKLTKEEEPEFSPCTDVEFAAFLDGLIVSKRGLREPPNNSNSSSPQEKPSDYKLSKNDILKKLRIAMNFREQEMLTTLKLGGSILSKAELSALFRKPGHKHFRGCGNQILRNFIKGLTMQLRET